MIKAAGSASTNPKTSPMSVQCPTGVVDIAVADEVEAIDVAKKYLAISRVL